MRRPVLRRILIGLAILGAMAVAFAAGILITIKNNGWTYRVNLPENSQADIDKKGNVTVTIPGEQESTKTPVAYRDGDSGTPSHLRAASCKFPGLSQAWVV